MPGKLVHFEIPARDAARAREFWGGVFGWQFENVMPEMDYQMVRTGEEQGGAVFPDEKRGLTVYFDTDDIDATIASIRQRGGQAEDKQPIPHVGWFARCVDTEGNDFSLFQSDESVQMPGA